MSANSKQTIYRHWIRLGILIALSISAWEFWIEHKSLSVTLVAIRVLIYLLCGILFAAIQVKYQSTDES